MSSPNSRLDGSGALEVLLETWKQFGERFLAAGEKRMSVARLRRTLARFRLFG